MIRNIKFIYLAYVQWFNDEFHTLTCPRNSMFLVKK